jgi:TP901 family phage tail tape measure protein
VNLVGQYGLGLILEAENRVKKVLKEAQGDFAGFQKSAVRNLSAVKAYSAQLGSDFKAMRNQIFTGMQFMAGGAAIAAPMLMLSKVAADTEDKLYDVKSLIASDMSTEEANEMIARFGDEILRVGRNSRNTLSELESVAYPITSALGIEDAIGVFEMFDKTAIATKGTITDMAKVGTRIMSTFGEKWVDLATAQEKAARMGNILSGTVKLYNTDLNLLAPAMSYTIGQASSLGVAFEEMTATIGMLQTLGLPDTIAGTAYSATLRSLSSLIKESKDAPDSLFFGVEIMNDAGKLLPIYEIVAQLEEKLGISAEQMEELAEQGIYGEEALKRLNVPYEKYAEIQEKLTAEGSRAVLSLLGVSDKLKDNIKTIKEANHIEAMWAARMESLNAKLQMTKNSIKETAIVMGTRWLDAEKGLLSQVSNMAETITKWAKENPELVDAVGKAGGTLAGAAISVGLGIALSAIGKMLLKHPIVMGIMGGSWLGFKFYDLISGKGADKKKIDEWMEKQKETQSPESYKLLKAEYEKIDWTGLNTAFESLIFPDKEKSDWMSHKDFMMKHGLAGEDKRSYLEEQEAHLEKLRDAYYRAEFPGLFLNKPADKGLMPRIFTDSLRTVRSPYMTADSITFTPPDKTFRLQSGYYDYDSEKKRKELFREMPEIARKSITLDINLSGRNLTYDIYQIARGVKKVLEEEYRVSEQGEM